MEFSWQDLNTALTSENGVALCTIIERRGSVPREVGARMLVRKDGSIIGTVGGGIGEHEVIQAARKTIAKSAPVLADFVAKGFSIISTEPTAVLALCKEWPDVLPSPEVKNIATNTHEFFEYVLQLITNNKIVLNFKTVKQTFGYHAPCHLKALQIGRPGVELLRRIPGVTINEINRGCCGIAGTYGFKKGENGYEQSMKIGAALFEELKKPENELGLSECSTCRMQMEHGSQKETVHPLEVLAKAMGLLDGNDDAI